MTAADLTNALERLRAAWITAGAPLAEHLAPGLPEGETRELLSREMGGAPDELVTWFGWHNGHDFPNGTPRWYTDSGISEFDLMTLDECFVELKVNRDIAREAPWGRNWWRGDYFPLLRGRGGESVVAITSRESGTCRVKYWHPEFPDCEPAADSVAALVTRWTDRIGAGDWVWTVKPGVGYWGPREGQDRFPVAKL